MTIDEIYKKFDFDIRDLISDSLEDTATQLADAQRNQMMHGIAEDGKKIGRYKDKDYANKKYGLNSLAGKGYVDLFFEGDFQGDIFADIRRESEEVIMTSADNTPVNFDGQTVGKTDKLVDQYGERIFGLSKEYANQYSQDYLGNAFLKNVENKLQ